MPLTVVNAGLSREAVMVCRESLEFLFPMAFRLLNIEAGLKYSSDSFYLYLSVLPIAQNQDWLLSIKLHYAIL